MKYRIVYEKYLRYNQGPLKTNIFEANSDIEAIIKVIDNCGYGYYDENDCELGDDDFIMPTNLEEVLEILSNSNGDGCDYVFTIQNITTNQTLLECDEGFEEEEVDW